MNFNFYANILESKENKGPVIGDNYFYQTKKQIMNWLDKHNIGKYKINADLTVDVDIGVDLYEQHIKKIPIKFNKVNGIFDIRENDLTSLKGCPEIVTDNFDCYYNDLNSLEYCPKIIGTDFDCGSNNITSLKWIPKIINGYFYCDYIKLETLEHFPIVSGYVSFIHNPIKTLKGLINVSSKLLVRLFIDYPELDIRQIEWNKVKNINKIVTDLYTQIEKKWYSEESEKVLKKMEELQLF